MTQCDTANLALAMLQTSPLALGRPANVGLLDLDIFGPSVPKIMGLEQAGDPALSDGASGVGSFQCVQLRLTGAENKLLPLRNHGVKTMSMGYLLRTEVLPTRLPPSPADPHQPQIRPARPASPGGA
jgi:Mrp family chromosome partitioning ATPase